MKYILSTLTLCALAVTSCQSYDSLDEPVQEVNARVTRNVFRLKPLKHGNARQINQDTQDNEDKVVSVVIAGKAATHYNAAKAEVTVPSANRTRSYIFVANLNSADAAAMTAAANNYTTAEYKTADYLRRLNNNAATKEIPMVATLENVQPSQFQPSTAAGTSEYDYVYNADVPLNAFLREWNLKLSRFPITSRLQVSRW